MIDSLDEVRFAGFSIELQHGYGGSSGNAPSGSGRNRFDGFARPWIANG
jgi:hypothetical protein